MRKNKSKELKYHGLFAIRAFFMQKLPKWFANWHYKSFKKSKAAFHKVLGMRSKYDHEFRYARYVTAFTTPEEEKSALHVAIARWMRREKLTSLLNYTSDIFRLDDKVYIVTSRPGLWIGKYGRVVDGLTAYLREHLSSDITIEFREMEDSVVEIRRIVGDFSDCFMLDEYADMSPWLIKNFFDCIEEYLEENPCKDKIAPLYESIDTSDKTTSPEYVTLDLDRKL